MASSEKNLLLDQGLYIPQFCKVHATNEITSSAFQFLHEEILSALNLPLNT